MPGFQFKAVILDAVEQLYGEARTIVFLTSLSNYRPHPKDGEGTVFTGVCLSTRGGTPSHNTFTGPMSFLGVPHLHPLMLPLDAPVTGPRSLPRWEVFPWPGQDGVFPPPPQNMMVLPPPPARSGWGMPPPPPRTEQQSEFFLRGGRYASCVHAGGLSS